MINHSRTDEKNKKYTSLDDTYDFPSLGSATKRETKLSPAVSAWSGDKKSFKEIVENKEVRFDYEILKRNDDDTDATYFSRLYGIFKRTTTVATYRIYTVTKNNKTYRVAARHEIIARMLCQFEENRNHKKASSDLYSKFRQKTISQMYADDEMWEDIMGYVGYDDSKWEYAIRLYYNELHTDNKNVNSDWLDTEKTKCTKGVENCISREKIIY